MNWNRGVEQHSPKRIKAVKFGMLSPKEIRDMSVTKIITPDTYDDDGFPIDMGLMDKRLGVIDPGLRCRTCNNRPGDCPGHFGHIELVAPVIHVGYAKVLHKILKSVCAECGRLRLSDEKRDAYIAQIEQMVELNQGIDEVVKNVFKSSKIAVCQHCGALAKDVKFEKPSMYIEAGQKLMPSQIRDRLERLPDRDVMAFGMDPKNARPEWMVLTVLPVPPVTVRPSITLESGQRSEDDLTHKLVDIIRNNQRFQENKDAGAPQLIIEDLWELLQYHVTTYIDNAVSGVPPARHRSGRPLKTLSQRLKGKEGRFRGNLSGKRVNFSARTVISPDPTLGINDVGIPFEIAREMSVPLTITQNNMELCRQYVLRGPGGPNEKKYVPGVNYVHRPDGRRLKVTDKTAEEIAEQLENGWKVDRQLKDGDIVLFNRQPSLHRMSIMAHYCKVMPGKTFRLNPAVCPPYNADFDGDEMNLHVLQSEEAKAEAKIIMLVQENILSPRFGGPIIGGIHDHISGMFLLTYSKKRLTQNDALMLLRHSEPDTLPRAAGEENGKKYWTGKQVFSTLLPAGLNLDYSSKMCEGCGRCKTPEVRELLDKRMMTLKHGVRLVRALATQLKGKELDERIGALIKKNLEPQDIEAVETLYTKRQMKPEDLVVVKKLVTKYYRSHEHTELEKRLAILWDLDVEDEKYRDAMLSRKLGKDNVRLLKALLSMRLLSGEELETLKPLEEVEITPGKFVPAVPLNVIASEDIPILREICPIDTLVVIRDGELFAGIVDERGVGAFSGKILDRICKEWSTSEAAQFIDRFTKLAIQSIMYYGFSYGIDDEDIDRETLRNINAVVTDAEKEVDKLINAYNEKELESLPGRTLQETLEMRIMQVLGKSRDDTGKMAGDKLGLENSAVVMASSGARGSMLNLTQMIACVGQQSVRGKRIERGYNGRTLPHFRPGNLGPQARGFVKNSYKSGLSPTEFFFHAMGGREGLVDTAVRTSKSGYLQRRLVNALLELEVKEDGTVRETRGNIVQFRYGEDGVDSMRSDWGSALRQEEVTKMVHDILDGE